MSLYFLNKRFLNPFRRHLIRFTRISRVSKLRTIRRIDIVLIFRLLLFDTSKRKNGRSINWGKGRFHLVLLNDWGLWEGRSWRTFVFRDRRFKILLLSFKDSIRGRKNINAIGSTFGRFLQDLLWQLLNKIFTELSLFRESCWLFLSFELATKNGLKSVLYHVLCSGVSNLFCNNRPSFTLRKNELDQQ